MNQRLGFKPRHPKKNRGVNPLLPLQKTIQVSTKAQLLDQVGRRTFKLIQRYITNVTDVFHPFRSGIESAGREVTKATEKLSRNFEFSLRLFLEADVIADR